MKPTCNTCALPLAILPRGITVCPRCDTSAQGNGMRVGPPTLPATRDGWFNAPFGDKK